MRLPALDVLEIDDDLDVLPLFSIDKEANASDIVSSLFGVTGCAVEV